MEVVKALYVHLLELNLFQHDWCCRLWVFNIQLATHTHTRTLSKWFAQNLSFTHEVLDLMHHYLSLKDVFRDTS